MMLPDRPGRVGFGALAAILALSALWSDSSDASARDVVTPDRPTYVEKTTAEQIAVATAEKPGAKSDLCLEFARERILEMEALANRRNFEFMGSLAEAWRRLAFDGTANATRLGIEGRQDMSEAFEKAARARRVDAEAFERLAAGSAPEEVAALFRKVAQEAKAGADEAIRERDRERERARLHEEMLRQARAQLGEKLRGAGVSPEDSDRLCERILERVRTHARVRTELLARVCLLARGGGEAEAADLAAEAALLAEAGASEEDAAGLAALAFRAAGGPKERLRLLRETRLASTAAGAEAGPAAARIAGSIELALGKGLTAGATLEFMRQVRRCLADGVPARIVFEALDRELREMKALDPRLAEAVADGLQAIERIRERLRKQAEEYHDRFGAGRDRSPGRGDRSGKGPG